MFQALNVIHVLGKSKTGTYSYEVCLDRVPIVITVDMNACILWQVLQQACGPCWAYNFELLQIMEGIRFFRKLFFLPCSRQGWKKDVKVSSASLDCDFCLKHLVSPRC